MNVPEWRIRRAIILSIAGAALLYAFCAGFRTIGDVDFGWQIASGRYIAQHHEVPRNDVFTYTVSGREWLYPPLGQLIFYWLFRVGGYAALSWLLAVAAVVTVAFLLRRPGLATGIAAILAVPSIVFRENLRAELFTTFFFAVCLSILWGYFREGRGRLWLLPVLMLFWANSHPGFLSGLALLGAYVLLELCEMLFVARRAAALHRLRKAALWLFGSLAVTVVNPLGPRIYAGLLNQDRSVRELGDFIGEWARPNLSANVFNQMYRLRDPESAFWWLLALVVGAIAVALYRKQIGSAVLLVGAAFLSIQYLRFQGLFACIAVVVGGAIVDEIALLTPKRQTEAGTPEPVQRQYRVAAILLCTGVLVLIAIRCADLISNRHYLEAGEVLLFGSGEATWFPEHAAKFVEENHLQGNLFNDFNTGGFLEWRLPEYKTYIDSRALPFGGELPLHQRELLSMPLDSPEWTTEAERYSINFLVLSMDRYLGLGKVPLAIDCVSHNWRPVYLDETGAVFLRNTPENAAVIQRLATDCNTVPFARPDDTVGNSPRSRGNAYNFFANAGSIFYVLGRDQEAQQFLNQAAAIEPHDSNLHLTRAQLMQADGRLSDAEQEYKASIEQRPTDLAWYLLGVLYARERQYGEAAQAMTSSARFSYNPADRYRVLGQIDNAMQQPNAALKAFELAEKTGFRGPSDDQKVFAAQIASARARSWELLHHLDRAIEEQRKSAELLPNDSGRWTSLAQLYKEKGDLEAAQQAQAKADALRVPGSAH